MSVARGSPRPPLTVTAPALVEGAGQHQRFRALVADLQHLSAGIAAVRDALGARLGVSGPGYNVFMAVAQAQASDGVGVGEVARLLGVTGAFVTTESGKLARAGLIEKRPNPEDGRGVLLRLTRKGQQRLDEIIPALRSVNDDIFGWLTRDEFLLLARVAAGLRERFDAVVPLLSDRRRKDAA